MSQSLPPLPGPDPQRISLEALKSQLRALPPPRVPEALQSKLISAIPPIAGKAAVAGGLAKAWYWIAGLGAGGILILAIGYSILIRANSNPGGDAPAPTGGSSRVSPGGQTGAVSPAALRNCEQGVQNDPYNAVAWFNLAKAQAEIQRTSDAISSGEKALDIAHSQNRTDLIKTIEVWLRSIRETKKLPR